jgi:hypothetical protein
MPPQLREVTIEHERNSWTGENKNLPCTFAPLLCSKQKIRRNVNFSNVEVFEIPNRQDFSKESIRDMYLTRAEIGGIHSKCWEIVDMMNMGLECNERPDFSKRGLTDLKDTSIQRRKRIRERAYKVVFSVQDFTSKKSMSCIDPSELLADLYRKSATQAKKDAYMSGIRDAVAAGMVTIL